MTRSSDASGNRTELTNEQLFEALASQTRRIGLFHLHQQGAATFADLVDVVREYTDTRAAVGADDPSRVATVLAEHHLPRLEQVDLVVYDRLHDTVELEDTPADFGDWLDLAIRRELRWAATRELAGGSEGKSERESEGERDNGSVTVLVVDDEPGMADVIGDFLETNHDMTAVRATSAPNAVSLLDSEAVDCIVSDYRMPAIDGLDFLEAVRDADPDLPFVLFTNKGSEEVASEAITHNVNAYVQKSTGTEQYDRLAQHIRRALGSHERPD